MKKLVWLCVFTGLMITWLRMISFHLEDKCVELVESDARLATVHPDSIAEWVTNAMRWRVFGVAGDD